MSEFKPMVKMYTDEPKVILKLKKGGGVHHKAHHKSHEEHGHKSMHHAAGGHHEAAEHGKAPKKPSMSERHKAMNPNQYAKGGKVHHKQIGGAMPAMQNPAGSNVVGAAPMQPMGRAALAAMAPAARMARAAAVRRALTGMKKGGAASSECAKLEKELKHHESMPMSKAHPVKKASGGAIDKAETRTTIEKTPTKFAKTKMDTSHKDRAHGTGEIKEGRPGGYASGGTIPADTKKTPNKGKIVMGGTIEGNEKAYENTDMHTATVDKAHGTKGVHMGNAGGFKHGGKAHKMHHKAKGGHVPGLTGATVEGGDWENRPANTAKPGVKGTSTGEVKESNAGGFKKGGAAKKAYATGGIVDDGKAVKMPRHFISRPVANSLQSGTFRKGGKVKKFDDGGTTGDPIIDRENARRKAEIASTTAENESMRDAILGAPRRAYEAVKGMFGSSTPPAGSVTKTEKSVTVTPGKKRGGKC